MKQDAFNRRPRPVVLCVLDGWGHRHEAAADDATRRAHTPRLDALAKTHPHAYLQASELAVGLPLGQMGNSEVGHMNLGAGRVVMQDLPRIDQAIASGALAGNNILRGFIGRVKAAQGRAHLLGLLSPGGVHAHQDHVAALAKIIAAAGVGVSVHAFLDGRDTPPVSAKAYLQKFMADVDGHGDIVVETISGRYFAMDRDQRWDRVVRAYDCITSGAGEQAVNPIAGLEAAYERKETDEFVLPTAIGSYSGMQDGDGLFMVNFRADRAREILDALLDPAFSGFSCKRKIQFSAALGMTEYSDSLNRFLATVFAPERLDHLLGEIVAARGLKQLRIAETEKYAHVTFFFNGGTEQEYPGETRILVPSPKVATYDLQPEMSALELTDRLIEAVNTGLYDFIVVNYANTDMVGHTGDLPAAIRAVETVDSCIGRLADALLAAGGALLITADHGNCEMMIDPTTGQPHTAHTTNPVPVMLIEAPRPGQNAPIVLKDGKLADVAPTLLELMHIPQPAAMTGQSLLVIPEDHRDGAVRLA